MESAEDGGGGGPILITIHHGDALLRGQIGGVRLFKMALTFLVPYVVSTLSSVAAQREPRKKPHPS
ncbi:MAG: nitrate/nitrite transporter NrtS [Acidobacteriota bacterium]